MCVHACMCGERERDDGDGRYIAVKHEMLEQKNEVNNYVRKN